MITDPGIDFGDNTYLISAPIGWGSVEWNVTNGYYTPTLSATCTSTTSRASTAGCT